MQDNGLLKHLHVFLGLRHHEGELGHLLLNHLGNTLPADPDDGRAFIHIGSDKFIHEPDPIDLGTELPVEYKLVLLGCGFVLEGHRLDIEQLVGTKERLSQGRISPFSLSPDQLGLNSRSTGNLLGTGLQLCFHQFPPADHVRDVPIMAGLGSLKVFLEGFHIRLFGPISDGRSHCRVDGMVAPGELYGFYISHHYYPINRPNQRPDIPQ